jgi:hypothetical protein
VKHVPHSGRPAKRQGEHDRRVDWPERPDVAPKALQPFPDDCSAGDQHHVKAIQKRRLSQQTAADDPD